MTSDILKRYRRIRFVVRFALTLGVSASIAANILHAEPNLISRAISAWAPLALLLCVELISRVPVHRRGRAFIRMTATTAIASIAAWVSYWHMVDVVARYGETGATPYLLPISVDGLIVVASICLVEIGHILRRNEPATTANADTGSPEALHDTTPPRSATTAVVPADAIAAQIAATRKPTNNSNSRNTDTQHALF